MLGINRLFVAEREQGGFDAFLLAPVDRSALLVAKAMALFLFLVVLEVIAVPAFGLLLLGPSLGPALPGLIAVLALGDVALAVIGTLVSAIAVQTRARDLIGPIIGLPLLAPGADRDGARRGAAARGTRLGLAAGQVGGDPRLSMMWCSPSCPTLCSTFSWRTKALTTYGRGLRGLSLATAATITAALALVFFYAPLDANQGFIQKIFYIHVPLAITALCGFVFGGVLGAMYLRTGDRKWDIRSYVAIHMALIFGDRRRCSRARSGPRRRGDTGGCGAIRR